MRRALIAIICAGCGSFGSTPTSETAPQDAAADAAPPAEAGPTEAGCAACAVETVVAKIAAPTTLFARAGTLYFTDGTKDVRVCDANACAPIALTNGPQIKAAVAASSVGVIAIDATCVSALRSDGVYLYDPGGGATVLGDPCPTSVTAAGSFSFFASTGLLNQGTSWSVKRCSASACEAIAESGGVSSFGTPKLVAATTNDVYVGSSNGRLLHWPNQPNAGAPVELLSGEFLLEVVTDGTSLAWLDGTRVRACTIADCSGTVHTVALDATAKHLAADATGLYWTSAGSGDADGKVLHAAATAMTATPIATGQFQPSAITTEGGRVYWSVGRCDGCAAGQGAIVRRLEP